MTKKTSKKKPAKGNTATKLKAKPVAKAKGKPATKAKAKPATKAKAKPATKAKAKPATKAKAKPATKAKAKPAPKTKAKDKPPAKAKAAPKNNTSAKAKGTAAKSAKKPTTKKASPKKAKASSNSATILSATLSADAGMLRPGDTAPGFQVSDEAGRVLGLSDFYGKPVVVYFYPKDDTPGCTKEACDFRDHIAAFNDAGVAVVGVSKDNRSSHGKFKQKYSLPFPLLSDENHEMAIKFGTWVEKARYGLKYMGIQRATFLIDKEGKVARVWPKVNVEGHVPEVLSAAQSL